MALELGQKSTYVSTYDPEKLFPIARKKNREDIGIFTEHLPFYGIDIWNHYEVSWLNFKGKPRVALAHISYDCESNYIIESKSMKLYFNSFNNTKFENIEELTQRIKKDLEKNIQSKVLVELILLNMFKNKKLYPHFDGKNLDDLDIDCSIYQVEPHFLFIEEEDAQETLCSDLLKSNCLITHQPDWGSLQISYQGKKINHEGLLKYIVSFRNHDEFAEHCAERIFMDILHRCQPETLKVHLKYTRRGGLDISCIRSNQKIDFLTEHQRLCRQ